MSDVILPNELNIRVVTPADVPISALHMQFLKDSTHTPGYWQYCSQRFFAIHDVMQSFNLTHVFHIETDVLVFWPLEQVLSTFIRNDVHIGLTLLNPRKIIPGLVYIRDSAASHMMAEHFLKHANTGENDMDVLGLMWQEHKHGDSMTSLPIVPIGYTSDDDSWSHKQDQYGFIFDGAALGQWLGGTDIICRSPHLHGTPYVNFEASYSFENAYITYDERRRPYVNGVPVFHVHSKDLARWKSSPASAEPSMAAVVGGMVAVSALTLAVTHIL